MIISTYQAGTTLAAHLYRYNYCSMLKNYIITAFRAFKKAGVYSAINILGLALGIACAALIFLWAEDELSFNKQFAKRNEIYSIRMNLNYGGKIESFTSVPGPMAPEIKSTIPGIVNTTRVGFGRELFSVNDIDNYDHGIYVDTGFFSMLQPQFIKGNVAGFHHPHTIVLTEETAEKYFPKTDPIGKTISIDHKQDFTIIGVVKNPGPNVSLHYNFIAPVENFLQKNDWLNGWNTFGIATFIETKPGSNSQLISKQLTAILQPKDKLYTKGECILSSMNDWHLRDNYINGKQSGGRIDDVKFLSTIAWIILIIACINFMNLATARAGQRAREIGVRKTIGAVRRSLITQFLAESLIMAFLAVLVSVVIIYLALPSFNLLVEKQLEVNLFYPSHIIALIIIGILCGLIAGSYPAFYLSSFDPTSVLKGLRLGTNTGAAFIRKALVVTQFAVSVILIICTVVIYQQIQHIKSRNLGYNKSNLLWSDINTNIRQHFPAIKNQLLQTGIVENASLTNSPLLQMWSTINSSQLSWKGINPGDQIKIFWETVTPEYISTMKLELKEGRNFNPDIDSDTNNIIINESMARLMGKEGTVGGVLNYRDKHRFQIIGVVKDYLFNNMYGEVPPLMLSPNSGDRCSMLVIRVKPGNNIATTIEKIRAAMKIANPGYPFDYAFADYAYDNLFNSETNTGKFAAVLAALTIFISCIGLFGLSAFTAERRTKEIGIRKVLGASVSRLTTLLAKEFIQLIILSCLIAFPLAWWLMNIWLNEFAYRTTISWQIFAATGVGALLIAIFTVSFQSIKAALIKPAKTLKSE